MSSAARTPTIWISPARSRPFRLPDLPFDLEIAGYLKNADARSPSPSAPRHAASRVVDDYYLMAEAGRGDRRGDTPGATPASLGATARNPSPFILAGASFHPFTVEPDERIFTVDMRKRLWPMPFTVKLDEFTAAVPPRHDEAAKFVSKITRIENGGEAKVTIQMNEPMRYEGLTFFQASYGPPGAGPGQRCIRSSRS